jgi:predicted transcriptional regulator
MEDNSSEMTIESLRQKIENQSKAIKELTKENDELYHQYNHLIIRNGKMLKRIDDFQRIIDDLHIRNEELQLINGNMLQLNDKLRRRNEFSSSMNDNNIERVKTSEEINSEKMESEFDLEDLYNRWKNFPGQTAQNGPNLRKQILMLVNLYSTNSLRATDLFNRSGVGGVTGARYVSTLKKFELIRYSGARKKGWYEITGKGIEFIEKHLDKNNSPVREQAFKSPENNMPAKELVTDRSDL